VTPPCRTHTQTLRSRDEDQQVAVVGCSDGRRCAVAAAGDDQWRSCVNSSPLSLKYAASTVASLIQYLDRQIDCVERLRRNDTFCVGH